MRDEGRGEKDRRETMVKALRRRLRMRIRMPRYLSALALGAVLAGSASTSGLGAVADEAASLRAQAERFLHQGRPAAALALYRDAYALAGPGTAQEALVGIGRSLLALGRPELAEPILKRATGGGRGGWQAHYAFGQALLRMGRYAEAARAFARAAAAGGDARARLAEAIARDAAGEPERREEVPADMDGTAAAEDPAVATNIALLHTLHGRIAPAMRIYRRLVAAERADVVTRHDLALALVFAHEEDRAAQVLRLDLDAGAVDATLRYFRRLEALPPAARVRALIASSAPMSHAPADTAIPVVPDSPQKRALLKRLFARPAPPPPPPPAPEPAPAPEPVDLPPLIDPTGWSVQIAAYRTPAQLKRGQAYYWRKYAEVLGRYRPRRSEIDYGPRKKAPRGFFYRLNVGDLHDRAEAAALCKRLKALGAPCWVRPPEPPEGRLPAGAESGNGKTARPAGN